MATEYVITELREQEIPMQFLLCSTSTNYIKVNSVHLSMHSHYILVIIYL